MRKILALVAALLLSACTTIGHQPAPEGWPRLTERVHYVSLLESTRQCGGNLLSMFLAPALACAYIVLDDQCTGGTCDIYLSVAADAPEAEGLMEHERLHCAGRDHGGATDIRDFYLACLDRRAN